MALIILPDCKRGINSDHIVYIKKCQPFGPDRMFVAELYTTIDKCNITLKEAKLIEEYFNNYT